MRSLMYAEGYGDLQKARITFARLNVGASTTSCESCPACAAPCHNGVRVRDRLLFAQAHLA
jgi:hypothetical protein